MAARNRSGCVGIAVAVVVIGGILVFAIIAMFYSMKAKSVEREIHAQVAEEQAVSTLVFDEDELPRFPFPKAGEPISREQFVAYMIDNNATALAKESFRKVASQASVSWKLRTRDIHDRNGEILGEFDLPWEIRRGRSSSGSSVSVRCFFSKESLPALLDLRRDDWVTVHGKLSFDGSIATIKDAKLGEPELPAERE